MAECCHETDTVAGMTRGITPAAVFYLTVPQLIWAGNAIVGRMVAGTIPPMTFNLLRWSLAFLILLPFTAKVFRKDSPLWPAWKRFALLGFLGVGIYNTLQYFALRTSSPINTTLVGASVPMWMFIIGWLFYGVKAHKLEIIGALVSMSGVLLVLSRAELSFFTTFAFVPGDALMVLAAIFWAFYCWRLSQRGEPEELRSNWSLFLMGQMFFGLIFSGVFTAGEWALTDAHIQWSGTLVAGIFYVAIGASVIAYKWWDQGVQRGGPAMAGVFTNLNPLFAAILSAAFLGEPPHLYHGAAFVLIALGIFIGSRR